MLDEYNIGDPLSTQGLSEVNLRPVNEDRSRSLKP